MGDAFARDLLGYEAPRVSILSIGEEEGKGNSQVKEAYDLLKMAQNLNFGGNAEGRDLFTGNIDVVVCDGFVGNVVVKMSEGLATSLVRMDRFTQFAVASAKMLLEDSKYEITDENAYETGVILGIGLGGLHTIETYHAKLLESGPNKISPFMIPMLISNMGPGQISIFTGAKGPNIVTTTACASAIHALGTAYSEMILGRATAVISGGVEATVTPLGVAGFTALKALSTQFNDEPARASRPFDAKRDGFVIGEGAGLVLLETLESAQARGAKIYAEMVGYGASGDAYHMTAPCDDGAGMARAMQNALREAGLDASAIGHINAHATSTMLNDSTETKAIKTVFGANAGKVKISATKSMTGHLLGAAGGIESVFTALALRDEMLPGTINLENPDPACDLDYMADGSKHIACEYAMA